LWQVQCGAFPRLRFDVGGQLHDLVVEVAEIIDTIFIQQADLSDVTGA